MGRTILPLLIVLLVSISFLNTAAQEIGDAGWVFDDSKYDSNYPVSKEFVKAGVNGGIPAVDVVKTVSAGANLQEAIDEVSAQGGGAILLQAGNYQVDVEIILPSRVVLRGSDQGKAIIRTALRAKQSSKKFVVRFVAAHDAGLENIEFQFDAPDGLVPADRENVTDGGWCGECFSNDPGGHDDLHVGYVYIDPNSKDCWVQNCRLIAAGTDPLFCRGDHNTFRKNYVDRSYNKGVMGSGYYKIYGDYNLVTGDTIKRIRHFSIQQGAKYNVVYRSYFEVDVNFHNGDDGYNLVEQCSMRIANFHGWDIFIGGVPGTHQPPGPDNMFFNNNAIYRWYGHRYDHPDTIYSFNDFKVVARTDWPKPAYGTLYPLKFIATALDSPKSMQTTRVYPNPVSSILHINSKVWQIGKPVDLSVWNNCGQLVHSAFHVEKNELDVSGLNAGLYILHIQTGDSQETVQFIKE